MNIIKNKITVIDSVMGSGKTSWAINKMKEDNVNKYVYITPYLTEIDRIKNSINNKKFYAPINKGKGKLDSLHKLLKDGRNVASTHALFKISNTVTKELIKSEDYVLILDEVMDLIEIITVKKDDIPSLQKLELITIEEDGLVQWNEDKIDYESQYDNIKDLCLNGNLYLINGVLFLWTFPIDIFNAFKKVYILTYLFDGQIQKYYYDLYNIEYEYKSILCIDDKYKICDYQGIHGNQFKELIQILDNDKMNTIGNEFYSLSKSWYKKDENKILVDKLKKNLHNYYINILKSKSKENLWTTYKDYKSKLSGKGYSRSFISCNIRATNEYAETFNLSYCCNIFFNPIIKKFFQNRNVKVDEETYALSELIQWIYRSRVRKNESIKVYIPSSRMRKLLEDWLEK